MARLERAGFRFRSWIGEEDDQDAVMIRSRRGTHFYGEVDQSGLVNGESVEDFLSHLPKS